MRIRRTTLRLRPLLGALGVVALALTGAVAPPQHRAAAAAATIAVDGQGPGAVFDGVGGISAGASARLLYDYPEPERSQVLDYLFRPDYGASLQILKVEIGGDTNSTDGAEASHRRVRGETNCDRGYEWWLMEQARSRNPDITLYGLEWGAPSWFTGGFYSQDNADYIDAWLECAEANGVPVDYVGGWNEKHPGAGDDAGWQQVANWYIALDHTLAASHPDVRIVAADEYNSWLVADQLATDPAFRKAVDVVGSHDPCGGRSLYQHCPSTATAQGLGKPVWDSETSSEAHDVAGGPLARSVNRDFLDGGMTAHIYWSVISSWYSDLPIADTGLLLADTPWSGHYEVAGSVWALAHTTQFTRPGWWYLDRGSGYLDGGGSYVSLRSPTTGDYTTVVETMDATASRTVDFTLSGTLSHGTVHEWDSDLSTRTPSDDFRHTGDITPTDGRYTVTLQPGHVYTFSTTTGQHKGTAAPAASAGDQLALPYSDDFDGYQPQRLARYFSDLNGGFQTEPCAGGRAGTCYAQVVTAKPIAWNRIGAMSPTTVVGDPRWWADYTLSTDVRLDHAGSVELMGRVGAQSGTTIAGDHLTVSTDGTWRLYSQDFYGDDKTLASGTVPFAAGAWHTVALDFRSNQIGVVVDGKTVGTGSEWYRRTGQVALRVNGWQHAQFDNVTVTPTAAAPAFLPHGPMSATATTAHTANYRGYTFDAFRAIDDRPNTYWHSEFDPKAALPQSITLDLGATHPVSGLAYQPRTDANDHGMITRYRILLSTDGTTFTEVAAGTWPVSSGTKYEEWAARSARYVRLEAVAGESGFASAAEINIVG